MSTFGTPGLVGVHPSRRFPDVRQLDDEYLSQRIYEAKHSLVPMPDFSEPRLSVSCDGGDYPPAKFASRYRIGALLGRGGNAAVHECTEISSGSVCDTDSRCAVKVINPSDVALEAISVRVRARGCA